MRRSEFVGTGEVFRFTLTQYLKSRSTIVTMLIMVIAVIAGVLIAGYSMDEGAHVSINTVAIANSTDTELTLDDIKAADALLEDVSLSDTPDATVSIEKKDGAYIVSATGEDAAASDLSRLENAALSAFNARRAGALATSYTGRAAAMSDYIAPQTDEGPDFSARFTVMYVFSILVLVLVMLSTTYIVRSIVEEKASKLVETLLVSIKPLALILGKILASMCLVVLQLVMLLVGGVIAALISKYLLNGSSLIEMVKSTGALEALTNLNAFSIFAGVLTILLGYMTFSLIGGISGACCDSMDDINSANMAVVMTAMIGYFVSIVAAGFEGAASATIFSLIPIVSIFVAPVKYVSGEISIGVLLGSWAIQLIVIVAIAMLCKKVYAELIIHRGGRVKLKGLMRIAREGGASK